jgi:hypothetical protein
VPGWALGRGSAWDAIFIFLYDNLDNLAEEPNDHTIEGTLYLLVELGDYSIPLQSTSKSRLAADRVYARSSLIRKEIFCCPINLSACSSGYD